MVDHVPRRGSRGNREVTGSGMAGLSVIRQSSKAAISELLPVVLGMEQILDHTALSSACDK
jgi:hypothetical protein